MPRRFTPRNDMIVTWYKEQNLDKRGRPSESIHCLKIKGNKYLWDMQSVYYYQGPESNPF
ncbi:unnamed protein product [marine sediment metagenome]|uniref:Uncharacterized protein n=1 Tax=marine sediment metagenome TaxID=412755 RepID=X1PT45_9ZZZZ